MHISSSYAKILWRKLFRTWEIPRSGSKAKDGEKRKRERAKVGDNNGQATHGARTPIQDVPVILISKVEMQDMSEWFRLCQCSILKPMD